MHHGQRNETLTLLKTTSENVVSNKLSTYVVQWKYLNRAGHQVLEKKTVFGKNGLGTRYLAKKSSGAAAYRYSNKKVAPLPLPACKTAAAAATLKK